MLFWLAGRGAGNEPAGDDGRPIPRVHPHDAGRAASGQSPRHFLALGGARTLQQLEKCAWPRPSSCRECSFSPSCVHTATFKSLNSTPVLSQTHSTRTQVRAAWIYMYTTQHAINAQATCATRLQSTLHNAWPAAFAKQLENSNQGNYRHGSADMTLFQGG